MGRLAQTLGVIKSRIMRHPEKVWIGPKYEEQRIFVLGESWYGEFSDELVTDDGYINAYLAGQQVDAMYTRIANACRLPKAEFWNAVLFTNFVQCVGSTRDNRPTVENYREASGRLSALLELHKPAGVWILGIGQSVYSAPIVQNAGIPHETSAHPTSYGLKNLTLGDSWRRLLGKVSSQAQKNDA